MDANTTNAFTLQMEGTSESLPAVRISTIAAGFIEQRIERASRRAPRPCVAVAVVSTRTNAIRVKVACMNTSQFGSQQGTHFEQHTHTNGAFGGRCQQLREHSSVVGTMGKDGKHHACDGALAVKSRKHAISGENTH